MNGKPGRLKCNVSLGGVEVGHQVYAKACHRIVLLVVFDLLQVDGIHGFGGKLFILQAEGINCQQTLTGPFVIGGGRIVLT